MTVSVLAWIGFATAIIAASTLSILQAVDGIALKRAVDSWVIAPAKEKMAAFRVAEGIRWTRRNQMDFRYRRQVLSIINKIRISFWIDIYGEVLTIPIGIVFPYHATTNFNRVVFLSEYCFHIVIWITTIASTSHMAHCTLHVPII